MTVILMKCSNTIFRSGLSVLLWFFISVVVKEFIWFLSILWLTPVPISNRYILSYVVYTPYCLAASSAALLHHHLQRTNCCYNNITAYTSLCMNFSVILWSLCYSHPFFLPYQTRADTATATVMIISTSIAGTPTPTPTPMRTPTSLGVVGFTKIIALIASCTCR